MTPFQQKCYQTLTKESVEVTNNKIVKLTAFLIKKCGS